MTSLAKESRTGSGWLVCLMLITFVIGTDDFIIAGILPEIARDQSVSEAAAGQLVTVFSVAYALAAPPLAVVTARFPRRPLVVGGLAVFALINVLTALAPGFAALMALRVAAALVAASITPAVFAMAATLSAPDRVGRSIGFVAAGLTVSLFVGVPIGSLLGTAFGWRTTFLAVALFTGVVLVMGARLLPGLRGAPEMGVREQLRILTRPAVVTCVIGTVTGAGSGLLVFTYIAPITRALGGHGDAAVALFIAVVGIAGALGTVIGGRLADRWGADRALVVTFATMVVAIVGLALIGLLGRGSAPLWLIAGVLAVYGASAWGFNPPMNARMLQLAGDAGTEAVALNTSGLYVGISLAGAVGGGAIAAYGGAGAAVTAASIGAVALAVMAVSVRWYPSAVPAENELA